MSKGKVLEGIVSFNKADKTITVLVKIKLLHPVYKRARLIQKKYLVHDPQNKAKIGDKVRIVESRPFSKHKHFRLLEILK